MAQEESAAPADDASVDGATAARLRVQKKTFRSRSCLQNRSRQIAIVLLCLLGAPIEHLMQRMDWLTERGKCLFDLAFVDMCPFQECRRLLCHAVTQGFKSGAPLFVLKQYSAMELR
eukprot:1097933-Karenia_brevis.AAC.1